MPNNFFLKTTYLSDLRKWKKTKIAYIPIGTLEWHGEHLPLETDFLVAVKICELVAKKIPGYILPPIYFGSDRERKRGGKIMTGMDYYVGKILPGNFYYIKQDLLAKVLVGLAENLVKRGFERIYIITGHDGKGQCKALVKAEKKFKNIIVINPYRYSDEAGQKISHADEGETSLLWACYPEEMKKGMSAKLGANDDFVKHYGKDPRPGASIKYGRKIFDNMVKRAVEDIRKNK